MGNRAKLSELLAALAISLAACTPAANRPPHPQQPPLTTTVDGSVIGVDNQAQGQALTQNVRLRLKPEVGDPVDIDLAPGWYLDEHGLTFSPNERVEVETTRHPGQTIPVARKVRRGPTTVVLRDADGNPTWQAPKQ